MRKRIGLPIALLASVLLGSVPASAQRAPMPAGSPADPDLRQAMRKLWADHVIWTRLYILSVIAGLPDAPAALNRLMKNQEEIGNAIVPYHGAAAGQKLTDLLKQHISMAGELFAAAKASDAAQLSAADKRWHDNAAEIATFLSSANPNWTRAALLSMLNQHLALTTQEATARLQKRWDDDVVKFDEIFQQALMMADALTNGILKQHPMPMRK